jgi:hypothetical protein
MFTVHMLALPMVIRKTFGKLGKRALARVVTGMNATLVLPDRSVTCVLENISRKGCRLQLTELPKVGATVVVRVDRVDALGSVTWIRGPRCGISFANQIPVESVERIRWAAEHAQDHETGKISAAGAVWR